MAMDHPARTHLHHQPNQGTTVTLMPDAEHQKPDTDVPIAE